MVLADSSHKSAMPPLEQHDLLRLPGQPTLLSAPPLPSGDKVGVIEALHSREIIRFARQQFNVGHFRTNVPRWVRAEEPYRVSFIPQVRGKRDASGGASGGNGVRKVEAHGGMGQGSYWDPGRRDVTRDALPCLALPCLALPCLALPCLQQCGMLTQQILG
jgi:hypothetical protein